ncbi:MAG: inositol monophosphatase family protein [Pseudanabaenaceae cyanobacterium SKYGB_i_bin29]|nr:inositol monophosphatase family protein [Pseudanabaenaceae cyanobacterium SKYG29]MDW8421374.1 inositol monophosphatase family protein [Pseudanabaenaceae cyanobacterium SKYGB_i_bin29]
MTYQAINTLVRQWGQRAYEWRQAGDFAIKEKTPGDYVTTIDLRLNEALVEKIREWFPADGILAEEDPQVYDWWYRGYDRLWCIDPIDGTSDLIAGKLGYAVMVGLLDKKEPMAGWIYAPGIDVLYFGDKTTGKIYRTIGDLTEEIIITPPPQLQMQVILSDKDDRKYGQQIRQVFRDAQFYSMGSFGLKIMEVILGKSSIYLYLNRRVKVWDTVAPLALAEIAGLVCCDLSGKPLNYNDVHPQTLAHLQVVIIGWADVIECYLPQLQKVLTL